MKLPCRTGLFLLNSLLVLNIAAVIVVEWHCRSEHLTLKFVIWMALFAHLLLRWPEIFYWWDKGHRRK